MFGLSFGSNKQKTSETATKSETGSQAQTGTNQTTTTGSSTTTGSTSNTSQGSSSTSQSQTGSQLSTQTSTAFSADVLKAINGNIGDLINKVLNGGASQGVTNEMGSFDPTEFINATMNGARVQAQESLGESVRGLASQVGGNANENSMSALLSNRMENATNASLATTQAGAVKTAQDIMAQRAGLISSAEQGGQNALAQILNALKGGESSTTGAQTNTGTTTGTTNTNESSNQNTNQTTNSTQTALEIIDQLLRTQSDSKGTSTGSTSKSGGGLSLGL